MSGHGIPHHAEKDEHKRIGIFIGVLAVIMAIIGAFAKGQANEMIVKEVKASNGFAWYQSKRQRSYMNELEIKRIDFLLAGTGLSDAQKEMLTKTRTSSTKRTSSINPRTKRSNASPRPTRKKPRSPRTNTTGSSMPRSASTSPSSSVRWFC